MDPPARPDAGDSPPPPPPSANPSRIPEPNPSLTDVPLDTPAPPQPSADPVAGNNPPSAPSPSSASTTPDATPPPPPPPHATDAAGRSYVAMDSSAPASAAAPEPSSWRSRVEMVKATAVKWSKTAGETSKMVESQARDAWQHLKIGPSVTEAAIGWLANGAKVIAEGGYDKIFRNSFEVFPEEQLRITFACYLSTSAGPVMGTLYISTHKIAFCSDNPLSYRAGDKTEWSYYKVALPLHQMRSVNPSVSRVNDKEKYIQIVSVDDHEFWFMGFLRYDTAALCLQESLDYARRLASQPRE